MSRTDAGGEFAVSVEPTGGDGPSDYSVRVERPADSQARAGELPLPVFSFDGVNGTAFEAPMTADRVQDITLPPLVTVTTHVQDADGNAVPGAAVRVLGSGAGVQWGTDFDGSLASPYWIASGDGGDRGIAVTDEQGNARLTSFGTRAPEAVTVKATFPTADGATLTMFRSLSVGVNNTNITIQTVGSGVSEDDTDGIPSAIEDAVPSLNGGATGDGNGDGTPDSEQPNVTSMTGTTGQWLTLVSPAGTELYDVTAIDPALVPAPPADMVLPDELTSFVVNGIPEGDRDQTITIYRESTANLAGYAKYNDATLSWSMLPSERVNIIDEHRVAITLTDGGVGDSDGLVNGSINDPGGLVFGMYRFDGFAQPINDASLTPGVARSVFKAGSTVPVKFQLKDFAGTIAAPSAAPVWLAPQKVSATNAAPNEQLWTETVTTGVEFELTGDTWHYNWNTKGYDGGYSYRIRVQLEDGTTRSVVIALK